MLAQYKMMTFMLVFFGFIFYKFPAGFMLYIMTSSGLGILESKIIKRELAHDEISLGGGAGEKKNLEGEEVAAAYPVRSRKAEEERKAGKKR
jgi:membrane protein insertase Oxa1/YidC/SpoIIIJ